MPSLVDTATAVLLALFGLAMLGGGAMYLADGRGRVARAWQALTAPQTPVDELTTGGHGEQLLKLHGSLSAAGSVSTAFLSDTPAKLTIARVARPWPHVLVNWLALRATTDTEKRRTVFQTVEPANVTLDVGHQQIQIDADPDDVDPLVATGGWDTTHRYDDLSAAPSSARRLLRERGVSPDSVNEGWFESRLLSEQRHDLGDDIRVFGEATVERGPDDTVVLTGDDLVYTSHDWARIALREVKRAAVSLGVGLFGVALGVVVLGVLWLQMTPVG